MNIERMSYLLEQYHYLDTIRTGLLMTLVLFGGTGILLDNLTNGTARRILFAIYWAVIVIVDIGMMFGAAWMNRG